MLSIDGEREGGWVGRRAARSRLSLFERNRVDDLVALQIEIDDLIGVPKRDVGTRPNRVDDDLIRKSCGHIFIGAYVERVENRSTGRIKDHNIVGEIVGDDEPVGRARSTGDHGETCWIRGYHAR